MISGIILSFVVALLIVLHWGMHKLWIGLPLILFAPLLHLIRKSIGKTKIHTQYPHINVDHFITLLLFLPALGYCIGKANGADIIYNKKVRYAKTSQFGDIYNFGNQKQIKYIGTGGNHFFFSSEDNS